MKDTEQEHVVIRKYLLGELDENVREQLEERVISDSDYKQEVLIVEGELLDEFVSGGLSPDDRKLFLRNFLASPAQRRKLETAKALHAYASNRKPRADQPSVIEGGWLKHLLAVLRSRNRFMQFASATAGVLLLIGSAALIYWLVFGQKRPYYDELVSLNQPSSPILEAGSSVASAQLSPLVFRGSSDPRTITVTADTNVLQLRMPTARVDAKYRVTLRENGGAEIFQLDDVSPRQVGSNAMLVLQIPMKMLTSSEYVIEVLDKGGPADNTAVYPFRIQRK
jgi:hypothetical protein